MRRHLILAAALSAACFATTAAASPLASSIASGDSSQCATSSVAAPFAAAGAAGAAPGKGISVATRSIPGEKSANQLAQERDALHAWLVAEAASNAKVQAIRVTLSRQELHSIGDAQCPECDMLRSDERRLQVGVGKPIGLDVNFAGLRGSFAGAFARGALAPAADGGFVWTTSISSAGAHALRVVFGGMDLPDDAELYVYNSAGEAFGPYAGRGMNGSGTLVSNTITGDTVSVQLRYYGTPSASDLARTRFSIDEVGHIGSRFGLAKRVNAKLALEAKAFCSYNADCVENGTCNSGWAAHEATRHGVAHMLFRSGGGYYICSGGLLGNTSNNNRPLFLTANHCISRGREAESLETFWDFSSATCTDGPEAACDFSYAQMREDFPTVLGATLLAHGTAGDYSLMDLAAVPPAQQGSTRTFLGFSTGAVSGSPGLDLFRVSHPSGAPQSFSRQDVNTTAGTCGTLPRGPFIYSTDSFGATEGGSSGSPVLNAAGQVVGQLYGACGTNLNDVCDANSNRTVDGALAHYFPNVDEYLAPGGGGGGGIVAHVGNIVLSQASANGGRTRGVATVTVLNASNQPISGATVAGAFSGFYAGTASGTTNGSGVVVLQSGLKKGSGTVNFCVNGITGTNMTYDADANTETCDSL